MYVCMYSNSNDEEYVFTNYVCSDTMIIRRKVKGVQQSQAAALPRHQPEKQTDKTNHAQMEQTYKKH